MDRNLELVEENRKLQNQLNYILNKFNEAIMISPQQKVETYIFTRTTSPKNVHYESDVHRWQFGTVTFDPSKFGVGNRTSDEKNYILWSLAQLKKYYENLYGCFEYTETGTVHGHFIAQMKRNPDEFQKQLKRYFTNNAYNNVAVKVYPAKYPNALNYINKIGIKEEDRGDEWYYYNPVTSNDLDYINNEPRRGCVATG